MAGYQRPFLDIYQTPRDKNTWRMWTKELAERATAVYRLTAHAAATEVYEGVINGLPGGPDYKELRESLRVQKVAFGRESRGAAYVVHASPRARRVRKMDVDKTVIYVRAKRRPDPSKKDIEILEDNGPWTPDTIPFWPKKSEAIVIQRKVSKREADVISKARKADVTKVRYMLMNVGRKVKKPKAGEKGGLIRRGKAVPDIAMQALSLEFGEEGRRAKPLWRRAVGRLKSSGLKKLPNKYKEIHRALYDANSRRWKSQPPKGPEVSQTEARKCQEFQGRLGLG